MHILFMDESGTPPSPGKLKDSYFVIAGVIIPERSWHGLRDALMGMKIRRKIRGEIKWRYFAPHNEDERNPMRGLSAGKRDEIRSEIYKILCADKAVRSIACVTCIEAAYAMSSINDRDDLYEATYKPMSERFQYYLQDAKKAGAPEELGIMVCDHRGLQDDARLKRHHQKLIHSQSEFVSKYNNLVEGLFLESSNLSIGIQLADMVAGAVWRKYERGDAKWFDAVKPSFRTSRTGAIDGYGMVKFPKANWKEKKDAG